MSLTPEQIEATQKLIGEVITTLMDGVMNKVLYKAPFLFDKWKAEKPLYAALVPKEIFKGSHFERRFVTPFGGVWEKLAKAVAVNHHGFAANSYLIIGNVPEERLRRISEVLNRLEHLEHNEKGQKRIKPNWDEELKYILEGGGNPIPVPVVCDLYIENLHDARKFAFELKSPLPNSDVTKVSKEKDVQTLRDAAAISYRRIFCFALQSLRQAGKLCVEFSRKMVSDENRPQCFNWR